MKTADYNQLVEALQETRKYLARPDNDFAWSSWNNSTAALAELDCLISRLQAGNPPARSEIEVLFLATGPIQEVSVSSGWGKEFLALARRLDAAVNRSYGPDPRKLAVHKAELEDQVQQLFGGRLRWFCTIMAMMAIGFAAYMYLSGDYPEVYFPLHLKGQATFYAILTAAVMFGFLAVVNWISWKKKRI